MPVSSIRLNPARPRLEWRGIFEMVLVLSLPLFITLPALLQPIEEYAYDAAYWHVHRAVLFSQALSEGWFLPRWVQSLNAGLGSPIFTFYSPLAYYLTHLLYRLGIPHHLGWRLVSVGILELGALGAYLLARALTRNSLASLVAAVGFVYAPHTVREVFERGGPEGLAMALYPWCLWGMVGVARQPSGRRLAVCVLLWAGCFLTHSLAALLLLPVALGLALVLLWRHRTWHPLAGLFLGLLLISGFLLPFWAESGNVKLENAFSWERARPAQNPDSLSELLAGPTIFDLGLGNNEIGNRAGWFQLGSLSAGTTVALARLGRKRTSRLGWMLLGFSLLGWGAIWSQTHLSNLLWERVGLLRYVQLRFRLMGLEVMAAALAAAGVIAAMPRRWQGWTAGLAMAGAVLLVLPYAYPSYQYHYYDFPAHLTPDEVLRFERERRTWGLTVSGEFTPIWREKAFSSEEAVEVMHSPLLVDCPGVQVIAHQGRTGHHLLDLYTPAPCTATLHLLYYPRWRAYVDGTPAPLTPQPWTGYGTLQLPPGRHRLEVRYEKSLTQLIGYGLSSAVAVLLVALVWRGKGQPTGCECPRFMVPWWSLAMVLGLALFKLTYVDSRTLWFRHASTPERIAGAAVHAEADFAGRIELWGYTLGSDSLRPGGQVKLTLFWWPRESLERDLHSFVHLLGTRWNPRTGGILWGQQDKDAPASHPTSLWMAGKIYRDEYQFSIPKDAPPGTYSLEIGWYGPQTGNRLAPELRRAGGLAISPWDSLLLEGLHLK